MLLAVLLGLAGDPSPEPHPTQHDLWPSLVVDAGVGIVRRSATWNPAGALGLAGGVTRTSSRDGRIRLLLGAHAGFVVAPGANYGNFTGTVGTAVSDYLLIALRGGPTLTTAGQFGGRLGARVTLFHLFGPEVFVQHTFGLREVPPTTSVILAFSVDVPATLMMGL
jgi:hypothetical protein